jgi:Flp pilus assembly protein TadB
VLFTTGIGLTLLAIGGVMQLLGYFAIRRILDIDI